MKDKTKKKERTGGSRYISKNRNMDYLKLLEAAGDNRSKSEKDIDSVFEFDDEEEEKD